MRRENLKIPNDARHRRGPPPHAIIFYPARPCPKGLDFLSLVFSIEHPRVTQQI
jgi:hypothetical protein